MKDKTKHRYLRKLTRHRSFAAICIGLVILTGLVPLASWLQSPSSKPVNDTTTSIDGWRWYEDEYFNIKFQYPPDWKVEKVDLTNYVRSEEFPGHDTVKRWELRVIPPWKDSGGEYLPEIQSSVPVASFFVIPQPREVRGFGSYGYKPRDWKYEETLDRAIENHSFDITRRLKFLDTSATSSISFGYSYDKSIVGIVGYKEFSYPKEYTNFTYNVFMASNVSHISDMIFASFAIIQTMQLFDADRSYSFKDFSLPVQSGEYIYP